MSDLSLHSCRGVKKSGPVQLTATEDNLKFGSRRMGMSPKALVRGLKREVVPTTTLVSQFFKTILLFCFTLV